MKKTPILSSLLLPLLLASQVHATTPMDQDNDGFPDVWEITFGFPVAANYPLSQSGVEDPTNQQLEDAYTVAQKAAAGTDPFTIDPGPGRPALAFNRSSSGTAINIVAKTVPGKHYTLLRSSDRVTWTSIAQANSGLATDLALYTVSPSAVTGQVIYYYKLQVSDVDTDNDGLTDWEEYKLGYNINGSTDLNSNGISDEAEYLGRNLISRPVNTVALIGSLASNTSKSSGIFSAFNTTTATSTRNSNLWAASYDMASGSNWPDMVCGTAITRKHLITVAHYDEIYYPHSAVRLAGKVTGNLYTIRLEATEVIPGYDLRIMSMNMTDIAAMEAIEGPTTVYPLLKPRPHDNWIAMLRDSSGNVLAPANRPLLIQTEMDNRNAYPVAVKDIDFFNDRTIWLTKPVAPYDHFFEPLNGGDSGHPVYLPKADGSLVLMTLNRVAGVIDGEQISGGQFLADPDIQAALETRVSADGYHLTLVDP